MIEIEMVVPAERSEDVVIAVSGAAPSGKIGGIDYTSNIGLASYRPLRTPESVVGARWEGS